MKVFFLYIFLSFLPLFFTACDSGHEKQYAPRFAPMPSNTQTLLVLGIYPFYNPQRLHEAYQPLVEHLNRNLSNVRIVLEASRSYDEFDKKLRSRHFHIALVNPFQLINSLDYGYTVFGKTDDDKNYRGIILVRKDGGIDKLTDLRGKTICMPAPDAVASGMMILYYLNTHGVNVNSRPTYPSKDEKGPSITRLYSGSHDSSVMNVYLKKCSAGATLPTSWKAFKERHPEIAEQLLVKWESPSLVNLGLVVRNDVPADVIGRVSSILFSLNNSDEGRKMLATLPVARFDPATKDTYRPVMDFIKKYRETIR